MRESLTRENVFVQEAGLKTRHFLPANFTVSPVHIQVYMYVSVY